MMALFGLAALLLLSWNIRNSEATDIAATDDPRCACLYRDSGEIPSEWIPEGAAPNAKVYGSSCGLWDQLPGTPFYDSCNVSAGADLCAQSWCQGRWCYVDPSCPSAATSTPGWMTEGTTVTFSYEACGSTDCYMGTEGCPYDPEGACGKPSCACKYQNGDIPAEWYAGGTGASLSMMPYYGTSCTTWDSMPGTPFFDSWCKGTDICTDSWCIEQWCYVDPTCPTAATVTNPPWANPDMNVTVYFSYETCGNPDCYMGSAECPYDDPRDSTKCDRKDCLAEEKGKRKAKKRKEKKRKTKKAKGKA